MAGMKLGDFVTACALNLMHWDGAYVRPKISPGDSCCGDCVDAAVAEASDLCLRVCSSARQLIGARIHDMRILYVFSIHDISHY